MANKIKRTKNILDKFRSYSYHFAVVLCDNTLTANALSLSRSLDPFNHGPGEVVIPGGKHTVQVAGNLSQAAAASGLAAGTSAGNGKYVVLINSMTDSEFVINRFEYTNMFLNDTSTNGVSMSHTQAFEGKMEIQEPLGVRFYNLIGTAAQKLKTNLIGCIWLIKPIFVGHTHAGNVESISSLKPIYLIAIDVVSQIDETGTIYNFEFSGATNGFSKSPQCGNLVDGVSMSLSSGVDTGKPGPLTVVKAMERVVEKIEHQYETYKKKLIESMKGGKGGGFDPSAYKPVNYVIELASESYQDVKYKVGTDAHEETTETGNEDPVCSFGYKGGSIETLIKQVLQSSKEIKLDAQGVGAEKPKRFTPKITTEIISTPDLYTVKYIINKYEHIGYSPDNHKNGTEPEIPEENTLFLNYIFTGKNLDIIEFDINMEFGLSFLMALATTDNLNRVDDTTNGGASSTVIKMGSDPTSHAAVGIDKTESNPNPKTPLFLGSSTTKHDDRNALYPVSNGTYSSLMQRQAAYETIDTKVKIRGNPALLTPAFTQPPPAKDFDVYSDEIEVPFNENFDSTPGYAKINILFPDVPGSDEKYGKFWYDGFYIMFSIVHIFEGGEFTQEIEMVGMPTFDDKEPEQEQKNDFSGLKSSVPNSEGAAIGGAATGGSNKLAKPITAGDRVKNYKIKASPPTAIGGSSTTT